MRKEVEEEEGAVSHEGQRSQDSALGKKNRTMIVSHAR
jgi:hypothetical protein